MAPSATCQRVRTQGAARCGAAAQNHEQLHLAAGTGQVTQPSGAAVTPATRQMPASTFPTVRVKYTLPPPSSLRF
eukprot:scaffold42171_cov75-Phaeocystis_antarctica.AAC.6